MQGRFTKDYWIIKWSGLFDPAYYLRQYPDVRQADVDPLEHFVLHGWKEGRNPNEWFNTREYLEKNPDVARAEINPFVHYLKNDRNFLNPNRFSIINLYNVKKFFRYAKRYGLKKALKKVLFKIRKDLLSEIKPINNFIITYPPEREWDHYINKFIDLDYTPLISVITASYNPPADYIKSAIESILNQTYPKWEMCIVDASTIPEIRNIIYEYHKLDKRIKVKFLTNNKGIVGNLNEAFSLAKGEYILILDHDDFLDKDALYEIALNINKFNPDVIYYSEAFVDEKGKVIEEIRKPKYKFSLLLTCNYIGHFTVKSYILKEFGGFNNKYEGAQDYALMLKASEIVPKTKFFYIEKPLYYWRMHENSTSKNPQQKSFIYTSATKALLDSLNRRGYNVKKIDMLEPLGNYKVEFPDKNILKIFKDTKIYICAPAKSATGGPELLHQLCYILRNNLGLEAYMYYYPPYYEKPVHPEYETYKVPYTCEIEDETKNIIIVPEVLHGMLILKHLYRIRKVVWFLSIDNYYISRGIDFEKTNYETLLEILENDPLIDDVITILTNTHRGLDFLKNLKGKKIYYTSEMLNQKFLEVCFDPSKKEDLVIYYPTKSGFFVEKIIKYCREKGKNIKFVPIENMTRDEVMNLLLKAKCFIDFGNHPGRDRLPREAAICGCIVILGKRGSVIYEKDVPIPEEYKVEVEENEIPKIVDLIEDSLKNYTTRLKNFEKYRDFIKKEPVEFSNQIRSFLDFNTISMEYTQYIDVCCNDDFMRESYE